MDLNDAPRQREFNLIPAGTIVPVVMKIRPGSAGEDGWLKRSEKGDAEMIDAEFIVASGEYAKRKLWANMVVNGTSDGHAQAREITLARLRAMIESARNIKPDDQSPEAREKRKADYADLNGMCFIVRIGIEKGKKKADGTFYPDRNTIDLVITPDRKEWFQPPDPPIAPAGGGTPPTSGGGGVVPVNRPGWAQ